jgi:SNF2 family DNA or RNA helicase
METLIPVENGVKKVPLKNAVQETGTIEVLRAPQALSHYLPELAELTSQPSVRLSEARLIDFLDNAAPLLSRLGIEVVLPKSLHRELKPRLVLATRKKTKSEAGAKNSLSFLGLNDLLDWEWEIAIGDQVITPHEFKALVEEKRTLVKFREQFICIDPEELVRLFKQSKEEREPTVIDFLKSHFAGDSVLSFDAERVMENLFAEQRCAIPSTLNASLRPYQERGYRWISSLFFSGFGCVLADDMGLGKTIQSIAVLLHLKEEGLLSHQCLVIAPASLIENWERELTRFAPSLTVARYHGAKRELDEQHDVFLTTYQTAVRDSYRLTDRPFSLLIVDEAHLMKNADTRGAKTVKSLHSQYRLALSGTPVENRLEDMRSLFDFILPGYLGNAVQFKEEFRNPIEVMRDKSSAERLRRITAPFLMRRLKTDKNIIADLPDKIIANEYAVLEKEQAALYESVVTEALDRLERLQHVRRDDTTLLRHSTLILSLLTSLKQICDHPRLYDKESPASAHLSGKAKLLLTLLEGILASGEKTLVFSQYVEALDCLKTIIEHELGESALIYHGGLSQQKRSAVIDQFQSDPANRILLVSLRAGGLGLNLTAASHVIHYDLWYNPAAEHQATDRAFRIGQQRKVFVHRFITKNSFEEKIDAMLNSKRELADMSVSSGESWLTRMSEAELRMLFDR